MSALAEERDKHGELPTCLVRCTVAKRDQKGKAYARSHQQGHRRLGERVPQAPYEVVAEAAAVAAFLARQRVTPGNSRSGSAWLGERSGCCAA